MCLKGVIQMKKSINLITILFSVMLIIMSITACSNTTVETNGNESTAFTASTTQIVETIETKTTSETTTQKSENSDTTTTRPSEQKSAGQSTAKKQSDTTDKKDEPQTTAAKNTETTKAVVTEKKETTTTAQTTTEKTFDVNYWISYAKNYAKSVGLNLDSSAVDCWDNPINANSKCIYLERDIKGMLNRYAKDDDITDVWIWAEKVSSNSYQIYIGYA